MAVGLRIRDANGNISLDVTDRITRYLNVVDTGGVNGRVNDARMADGSGWFHVITDSMVNNQKVLPVITLDAGGIAWSYSPGPGQTNQPVRIIFGLF